MNKYVSAALKTAGILFLLLLVAAIIFPMFAKVRGGDGSRRTCARNLMQLGTAFSQYEQDSDELMPNISEANGKNTWREAIYPFIKTKDVYYCGKREKYLDSNGFSQNFAANYSGNGGRTQPDKGNGALAGPGSKPLAFVDFPSPASLILLTEAENNNRPDFNIDDPVQFGPNAHKLWAGHSGRGNYLFVDGHVKALSPSKTNQADTTGALVNLWYRDSAKPLSANGAAVLSDAQARFGG